MQAVFETNALVNSLRATSVAPGFYNIPADEYHAQSMLDTPALTSSIAKLMVNQSPRHAYHAHCKLGGGERDYSDDLDFGTIVHKLILGKGSELAIADFDDWRTKAAKEFKAEARNDGRVPVLACKMEPIIKVAEAFARQVANCDARGFYGDGAQTEIAGIWNAGDVVCQTLFDRVFIDHGHIYDVKSTTDAHPKKLNAQIINLGYDIQAEFYTLALETLRPELAGRVKFTFLFIEKTAPYCMTPIQLSGTGRALGRSKVERAIADWRECLDTGFWPGYTAGIITSDPPKWAMDEEFMGEL